MRMRMRERKGREGEGVWWWARRDKAPSLCTYRRPFDGWEEARTHAYHHYLYLPCHHFYHYCHHHHLLTSCRLLCYYLRMFSSINVTIINSSITPITIIIFITPIFIYSTIFIINKILIFILIFIIIFSTIIITILYQYFIFLLFPHLFSSSISSSFS